MVYTSNVFVWQSDLFYLQWKTNTDSENKAVTILPRKPPAERVVSMGWIITFHADDNEGMSALLCSSVLCLSTLLLNCEQNGSYWLLQFSRGGLCRVLCLTFHSPVEHGRCCWGSSHNEHHKCAATRGRVMETVNLKVTRPRRFWRVLLKNGCNRYPLWATKQRHTIGNRRNTSERDCIF